MIVARRRIAVFLLIPFMLFLAGCESAEERKLAHQERGLALVEEGRPKLAVIEFTNALRIDEAFLPAHRALAALYKDQGDQPRAAAHFKIIVEAAPEDVEARASLGRILFELGDLDGAGAQAAAARAIAPDDPRLLGLQAAVDFMGGDAAAALPAARKALAADPGVTLARLVLVADRIQAGDPRGALTHLDGPLEEKADGFELGLIRIRLLEQLDDRAAVGATLKKLAALQPENDGVRLAIARWHMQADPPDAAAAEAELRAAAALRPEDPDAALRVVDFLRQTAGMDAARAELERLAAPAGAPAVYERALATLEANAGDRAGAIARMEAAADDDSDPEAADQARILLARMLDPATEGARRAALIEEVLARDSSNMDALVMRAGQRMRADDYEAAIADLRTALDAAPESATIYEMMAEAHERNGAPALAAERRALAVRASQNAPGPSLRYAGTLMAEGKAGSAESVLLDALRRAPKHRGLLTALSRVRLARKDWQGAREAIAALETAGDVRPAVTDQLRAAALAGEGRVAETLSVLETGWETRGEARDLEALVRAYAGAGEFDKAEALLRARLEDAPEDLAALTLLARLREAASDPAEAEALLRKAIAAAPENGLIYDALARFHDRRGAADKAAAVTREGLARDPANPALRFRNAMRLELEGDYEGAIAIYDALYDADPGDSLVANNLASLLSDYRDDPESLARAATVARRLRGSQVPAFQDTYGWTLFLSGDHAGAIATLRESAAALSGNAIAQHHLAMAYWKLDQGGLARERFRRALELADAGAPYPQRPEAEAALAAIAAAETAAAAKAGAGAGAAGE